MRGVLRPVLTLLVLTLLFAVVGLAGLRAQDAPPNSSAPSAIAKAPERWDEAVAIVRDVEQLTRFFTSVAQYEVIASGAVAQGELVSLGLDASTRGTFALLREPGQTRGAIRLIQLDTNLLQVEARSSATLFDTGGIAGLNVRVDDIDAAFAKMQAAGWRAFADPLMVRRSNYAVAEAIFRGPDGLVIGLIERSQPALGPQWQLTDGRLSRPSHAFAVVADIAEERAFFAQRLGWESFLSDRGAAGAAGPNLYGWPHNLVSRVARNVEWLHGARDPARSGSEGAIALMQFEGLEGRDLSRRTAAPNFGFIALRLLGETDPNAAPMIEGERIPNVAPYGPQRITTMRSPAGIVVQVLRDPTPRAPAP